MLHFSRGSEIEIEGSSDIIGIVELAGTLGNVPVRLRRDITGFAVLQILSIYLQFLQFCDIRYSITGFAILTLVRASALFCVVFCTISSMAPLAILMKLLTFHYT